MADSKAPEAHISPLSNPDGSVTLSHAGYKVVASVNGPIEASRRDEDAFEAVVSVTVRPSSGIGGTRERHLESIIEKAVRQLILLKDFPRSLFQITLQVTEVPQNDYATSKIQQAKINLPIIPALLHAAVLALLSGAIPMRTIATAICLAVSGDDAAGEMTVLAEPSPRDLVLRARSVHVLGFTASDDLFLAESEGAFTVAEWDEVVGRAREICCQPSSDHSEKMALDGNGHSPANMRYFIRSVMASKIAEETRWTRAA